MNTIIPISVHEARTILKRPYYLSTVSAGFPSPAEDYMEQKLDLNEYLIRHPAATIYCRASGHSMKDLGILDGCLLVVDRAMRRENGSVVLAAIHGDLTCKVLDLRHRRLLSGNPDYPPIPIPEDVDVMIEGVVLHAINTFCGHC